MTDTLNSPDPINRLVGVPLVMTLFLPSEHEIDVNALARDLFADGFDLKAISQTGELVIDSTNGPS